ncbi:hypothetical protein WA026_011016 [Henosepilachna vigintioctopunctata]|uniref:Uncharacterized protein n=1 Tax=Henosepilachna vigintioctopunctata TaxID=420089 RepID=A0AAW1V0Z2_9CUCU
MPNQTNSWLTVEDIKRDLFGISGLPYPPDENIIPPKIISEYRLRTSQANSNVNLDESTENVFICGRGKFLKDGVLKPGEPVIEDNSTDNSNIEKQIRQLSYSYQLFDFSISTMILYNSNKIMI